MCIRDRLKDNKLSIVATDLDIVFYDEINQVKILKEGSTTTSAAILYDILRKISSDSELKFDLKTENKLSLKSDNSDFNLLCLPTDNFPTFVDEFEGQEILLNNSKFLKLLNKTKIAISNDDTRHYLNGIFLHLTEGHGRNFLTGVATDSHRLSSSSLEIENVDNFSSLILPRKTVFQLCSLLTESAEISLSALVADASGQRILRARASGSEPVDVAADVVDQLYTAGAQEDLDSIRQTQ